MKKCNSLLFILLFSFNLFALTSDNNLKSKTKQLFLKSELFAMNERSEVEKNSFLDPVWRNLRFIELAKNKSPDLIANTNYYKWGLFDLLTDSKIKKDNYTDIDIVNILYNLCLDDYIQVVDSAYFLVKQHKLKIEVFELFINQDFNITNRLAKNYKYPPVTNLLKSIRHDLDLHKDRNDFIDD